MHWDFFVDANTHGQVCTDVRDWIDLKYDLTPPGGSQSNNVRLEEPLPPQMQAMPPLFVTRKKVPDVS